MKKIPTLFRRVFDKHKVVEILPEITPGCEEAFLNGRATVKVDGACCAFINGEMYKRYDAKKGKKPPVGAIPCGESDPVTGHWPHWVKIDPENQSDKWFVKAAEWYKEENCIDSIKDGTYEAIGRHFNGNPYSIPDDILYKHGQDEVIVNRDFDSIKEWLNEVEEEGLVFWLNDEAVCKIKRTDFGLKWPVE